MKSKNGSFGRRPRAMMSSFLRRLPVFLVSVVVLILASAAPELRAKELQFDRAKIIIEFNSTANEGVGDVGVQVLLDGEPWQLLKIKDPRSRTILNITASASLRRQGLTELFFESSEPSLDEVPLAEFLARFPEGEYEFEGRTIEGRKIEGEANFTHVIPAGPVIVSPENGAVVNPSSLVIQWQPVTTKIAGSGPLVVVAYQVVVDGGDPSRRFDVTVAAKPTTMSVTVPPQFLEPGTEYTFEVLAIEVGGNQTITEGFFATQ
jgi:Fibronectin type III domain